MKAKIAQIFPPILGNDKFEFARIKIGLSEGKLVGVPIGKHKVGDEIELSYHFAGPEADGLLLGMALELYEKGSSEFQLTEHPELGTISEPLDYKPNDELSEVEAAYLRRIWQLMKQLGVFNVKEGYQFYALNFPNDEVELHGILELGHLIAEHHWKAAHESAAKAEYVAQSNRMIGVRAASKARKVHGGEVRTLVANYANEIVSETPILLGCISELARRVIKREQVEGADYDFRFPRHQRVRKILSELVRTGEVGHKN